MKQYVKEVRRKGIQSCDKCGRYRRCILLTDEDKQTYLSCHDCTCNALYGSYSALIGFLMNNRCGPIIGSLRERDRGLFERVSPAEVWHDLCVAIWYRYFTDAKEREYKAPSLEAQVNRRIYGLSWILPALDEYEVAVSQQFVNLFRNIPGDNWKCRSRNRPNPLTVPKS